MPPSYQFEFCLKAMRRNSNRAGGSPGEMNLEWRIPVDGQQRHDVGFVYRDEVATFERLCVEDVNIKSNGTKAIFCEH